jgi:hypothetical protein
MLYDWWLEGSYADKEGGNQEEGTNAWAAFIVDADMRAVFPELAGKCLECGLGLNPNLPIAHHTPSTFAVAIEEDDNGFIHSQELSEAEFNGLAEPEERDPDPDEPEDDDWVTSDHVTFTQAGRVILSLEGRDCNDSEMWAHIRAAMSAANYWPNVWFISDHGNAYLMVPPEES